MFLDGRSWFNNWHFNNLPFQYIFFWIKRERVLFNDIGCRDPSDLRHSTMVTHELKVRRQKRQEKIDKFVFFTYSDQLTALGIFLNS